MIKSLLSVRFRALFAGMTAQGRKKKKRNTGMVILFAILYLYLIAAVGGVMCLTFYSLAEPYHTMGLDWLYFAIAGLMGLGLAVFGSNLLSNDSGCNYFIFIDMSWNSLKSVLDTIRKTSLYQPTIFRQCELFHVYLDIGY